MSLDRNKTHKSATFSAATLTFVTVQKFPFFIFFLFFTQFYFLIKKLTFWEIYSDYDKIHFTIVLPILLNYLHLAEHGVLRDTFKYGYIYLVSSAVQVPVELHLFT